MIGGTPALSNARDRLEGYRNALKAAGVTIEEKLIKEGNFKIESGYRFGKELAQSVHRPQAIFVANNLMTLGAVRALRELNIRIPQDMAIVGFDDTPWADELRVALTVVSQPTYQLGQTATQLLLNRLAKPDAPFQTAILHTHLIIRESCGAQFQNQEKIL
jgi:DNA-binding LacI/PurR family transcriptional regulator